MPITEIERALPDAITMVTTTDLKGTVVSINADFIAISGFSAAELLGASHNLLRHPHMPTAIFDHLWHTLRKGAAWNGLLKNRCKNGDYFWSDVYIEPIVSNSEVVGYQAVLTRPNRERVMRTEQLYEQIRNTLPIYNIAH